MAGKLAAALTTLVILVGCAGVETPTVTSESPPAAVVPEEEPSIAFLDKVAFLLHINLKDGSYRDMMGMDDNRGLILQPRYICEALIDTEVVNMTIFLNQRNVPIKGIEGFCVNPDEMKAHTDTHPKPTNGRPPWIPNMRTIEVSN